MSVFVCISRPLDETLQTGHSTAADHESGREKVDHHQFLFAFVLS